MYMDTSIVINEAKSLNPIFNGIKNGKISEAVFLGSKNFFN